MFFFYLSSLLLTDNNNNNDKKTKQNDYFLRRTDRDLMISYLGTNPIDGVRKFQTKR